MFAVRDGDNLLSGFIDRLVLICDDQRPVAADVVDFKTDAIDAHDEPSVTAKVNFYRPQLAAYRRAVAQMFRLPELHVSARLVFVGAGLVRNIDPAASWAAK